MGGRRLQEGRWSSDRDHRAASGSRVSELLPSERAFYRLIYELAGEGLFCTDERISRDGMHERILDAFDAAMAEARSAQHQPQQRGNGERPKHEGEPIGADVPTLLR